MSEWLRILLLSSDLSEAIRDVVGGVGVRELVVLLNSLEPGANDVGRAAVEDGARCEKGYLGVRNAEVPKGHRRWPFAPHCMQEYAAWVPMQDGVPVLVSIEVSTMLNAGIAVVVPDERTDDVEARRVLPCEDAVLGIVMSCVSFKAPEPVFRPSHFGPDVPPCA